MKMQNYRYLLTFLNRTKDVSLLILQWIRICTYINWTQDVSVATL